MFYIVDDQLYGNALKNISNKVKKGGDFIFTENLSLVLKKSVHIVSRKRKKLFEKLEFHNVKIAPVFVLINEPIGAQSFLLKRLQALMIFILVSGYVLGPVLFLIKGLLINIVFNGPSTYILICKKM